MDKLVASTAAQSRHLPAIQPLTARSVVLSTLLGYHPPALPIRALIRVGGLLGVAEPAIRVAVTRMVAEGDIISQNRIYRLSERLIHRQARQDESCSPRTRRWRGGWEMAFVTAPPRPLAERVALRKIMVELRLAELREGVWLRPANLMRKHRGPALEQCTFFEGRPEGDPLRLANSLWDLPGWADEARRLRHALDEATDLVAGFMVTAAVLRHLLLDPVLPPELLPEDWPGPDLRARYAEFSTAYAAKLRDYCQG